jgi:4-amino-4-deoxy-L-arabinose transferase-like glycosyltransferase
VPQRSESQRARAREAFLWICLLFVLGAALRAYRLGQNSLWIDEYASLVTARFPLGEISSAALHDDAFEPPLYFWLLHLVVGALGDSEKALRLASAVAGTLTIPLIALLIRELGESPTVAVFSAGLLALSPLHLWYSQEARPYALLVWLGTGSLVAVLVAMRSRAPLAWAGFVVLASLAVLTHVFGLLFPLVAWMWAFTERRRYSSLRSLLVASGGIALLTAPFMYRLVQAVLHAAGTGSAPRVLSGLEIPYTLLTYVGGYSFGPSVREIQDHGASAALRLHAGQSGLEILAVVSLMALAASLKSSTFKSLAILFLLPLTLAWIGAALTGKAYNVRYTLPGLIGFLGLAALAFSRLNRQAARWAVAVTAGLFLWADAQWFFVKRFWKEDSRSAVAWLRETLPVGSIIAVAPGYQARVLSYYSRHEGVDVIFAALPDSIRYLELPLPRAFLLTRLHHVPHWRELVQSLESRYSSSPAAIDLVGYRVFLIVR